MAKNVNGKSIIIAVATETRLRCVLTPAPPPCAGEVDGEKFLVDFEQKAVRELVEQRDAHIRREEEEEEEERRRLAEEVRPPHDPDDEW